MNQIERIKVESEDVSDFARIMGENSVHLSPRSTATQARSGRLNLDPESTKNGIGQLVLTLVKLLHELLERQAIRRIDGGSLNDNEIERLGVTFMRQAKEIERLRREFGLEEEDLNIDLGPLGKLL